MVPFSLANRRLRANPPDHLSTSFPHPLLGKFNIWYGCCYTPLGLVFYLADRRESDIFVTSQMYRRSRDLHHQLFHPPRPFNRRVFCKNGLLRLACRSICKLLGVVKRPSEGINPARRPPRVTSVLEQSNTISCCFRPNHRFSNREFAR